MHAFFKGLSLFNEFTDDELETVSNLAQIRKFSAGETVIRQHQPVSEIFVIRSGYVRVTVDSPDGSTTLAVLPAGATLGELSLIDDQPPSASAVADEDSVLYSIEKQELLEEMARSDSIARKILWSVGRTLATRLRQADQSLGLAKLLIQRQDE